VPIFLSKIQKVARVLEEHYFHFIAGKIVIKNVDGVLFDEDIVHEEIGFFEKIDWLEESEDSVFVGEGQIMNICYFIVVHGVEFFRTGGHLPSEKVPIRLAVVHIVLAETLGFGSDLLGETGGQIFGVV
jgi:hypothetical protein